ncbi:MAG: DEAD/DEAH box helicase, partial [Acidipropionibacterium acidipropionici]|nr:DEAD/DEAH box helicase [Acidipropionibacterium acidipropionici]
MTSTSTLASVIRSMDTDQMTRLLDLRPDLANPAPRSLAELAERASTQASARAALDRLNAWQHPLAVGIAAPGGVAAAPQG